MGFEEAGRSSIENNAKLKSKVRKQFFSKTFSSPVFGAVNNNQDPEVKKALKARMNRAEQKRVTRLTKEYLVYILVIVLVALFSLLIYWWV